MSNFNGYKIMAVATRKAAAGLSDEMEKAKLKARAEIYDYLATLEKEDFFVICDSGAFNDVIRGYLLAAYDDMGEAHSPEAQRTLFLNSLNNALEDFSASQAEEYYKRH